MIYLDNSATTKPCSEAVAAVQEADYKIKLLGQPVRPLPSGRGGKTPV